MKNLTNNLAERARRSVDEKTHDFVIFVQIKKQRETIIEHPVAACSKDSLNRSLDRELKIFCELLPETAISVIALAAGCLTGAERFALAAYTSAADLLEKNMNLRFSRTPAPKKVQLNLFDYLDEEWAWEEAERIRRQMNLEELVLTGLIKREEIVTGEETISIFASYEPRRKPNKSAEQSVGLTARP